MSKSTTTKDDDVAPTTIDRQKSTEEILSTLAAKGIRLWNLFDHGASINEEGEQGGQEKTQSAADDLLREFSATHSELSPEQLAVQREQTLKGLDFAEMGFKKRIGSKMLRWADTSRQKAAFQNFYRSAQAGFLDALRQGNVQFTTNGQEKLDALSLMTQGNEEFYTRDMINARGNLRVHPTIIKDLMKLWELLPKKPYADLSEESLEKMDKNEHPIAYADCFYINRNIYTALSALLFKRLVGHQGTRKQCAALVNEDWKKDASGNSFLTYHQFCDCMFTTVDVWCMTVEISEYEGFFDSILFPIGEKLQFWDPDKKFDMDAALKGKIKYPKKQGGGGKGDDTTKRGSVLSSSAVQEKPLEGGDTDTGPSTSDREASKLGLMTPETAAIKIQAMQRGIHDRKNVSTKKKKNPADEAGSNNGKPEVTESNNHVTVEKEEGKGRGATQNDNKDNDVKQRGQQQGEMGKDALALQMYNDDHNKPPQSSEGKEDENGKEGRDKTTKNYNEAGTTKSADDKKDGGGSQDLKPKNNDDDRSKDDAKQQPPHTVGLKKPKQEPQVMQLPKLGMRTGGSETTGDSTTKGNNDLSEAELKDITNQNGNKKQPTTTFPPLKTASSGTTGVVVTADQQQGKHSTVLSPRVGIAKPKRGGHIGNLLMKNETDDKPLSEILLMEQKKQQQFGGDDFIMDGMLKLPHQPNNKPTQRTTLHFRGLNQQVRSPPKYTSPTNFATTPRYGSPDRLDFNGLCLIGHHCLQHSTYPQTARTGNREKQAGTQQQMPLHEGGLSGNGKGGGTVGGGKTSPTNLSAYHLDDAEHKPIWVGSTHVSPYGVRLATDFDLEQILLTLDEAYHMKFPVFISFKYRARVLSVKEAHQQGPYYGGCRYPKNNSVSPWNVQLAQLDLTEPPRYENLLHDFISPAGQKRKKFVKMPTRFTLRRVDLVTMKLVSASEKVQFPFLTGGVNKQPTPMPIRYEYADVRLLQGDEIPRQDQQQQSDRNCNYSNGTNDVVDPHGNSMCPRHSPEFVAGGTSTRIISLTARTSPHRGGGGGSSKDASSSSDVQKLDAGNNMLPTRWVPPVAQYMTDVLVN